MAKKYIKYHIPKKWIVKIAGDQLIVSGGADVSYQLDITDNLQTEFAAIKNSLYSTNQLSDDDRILHEQLLAGGIALPKVAKKAKIKIRIFGEIGSEPTYDNAIIVTDNSYDLGIILNGSATLAELLQKVDYQSVSQPHILFDTTNYQNISVGPLVFPGETACLACLQGRLEYRWSDDEKPKQPRARDYSKLLTGLIDREIRRFIDQDYSMIGQTVAFNFDDYSALKHPLYKLEKCPICDRPTIDRLKVIA